jgi:quercetin dioxygenase-like cupin family protein
MTINDILAQLETSNHPVAKALHKGEHFRVLIIGFKKGMILKDHQTHLPAKLTVLKGKVAYHEGSDEIIAKVYDEVDIPIDTIHNVLAIEDSLCLLTQG